MNQTLTAVQAEGSQKGDAYYLVNGDGETVAFRKFAPERHKRKGLRRVLPQGASGRHRRLAKEAFILNALQQRDFQWLRTPAVLGRADNSLDLEYLPGRSLETGEQLLAARALAELNATELTEPMPVRRYLSLRLATTFTPFRKVTRIPRHLRDKCPNLAPPVQRAMWKLLRSQPARSPVLLNRDVHAKHFIVQDGGCAMVDFETSGLSRRWALLDIVCLAMEVSEELIDLDVLDAWLEVFRKGRSDWADMDLVAQLRFAMLYEEAVRVAAGSLEPERRELMEERLHFALKHDRVADFLGRRAA